MERITLIKSINPNQVCKKYRKTEDGKITKSVVANVVEGKAKSMPVPSANEMVDVLKSVSNRADLVICSGVWENDPGCVFDVISEAQLAKELGSDIGVVPGGVIEFDGRFISARLKRGIRPSRWILLDADNPPGIPDEWAAMSISERLELWEPLLPGISKVERIELRGSSARVVNGSGSQKATHAWLRVNNPDKIALMKAYLSIEIVNQGVSFQYKKHSTIDKNKVVGIESRSVFDLAVFDTGRLVFCAKPDVHMDGYKVDDAGIQIINEGAGELDIDWIKEPTSSLIKYKQITGILMDVSINNDGYVSIRNSGQLTMDTEIVSKGVCKTLSDWVVDMSPGDKLRCESPFRQSASEAAFIRIDEDGIPFVYDIGNGTTYRLNDIKPLVLPSLPVSLSDWDSLEADKKGYLPTRNNLLKVISEWNLRYDEFLGDRIITINGETRIMEEEDYTSICIYLEEKGFKPIPINLMREMCWNVAMRNKFDSAIDWGKSLNWDGISRCEKLLTRYFGADDNDWSTAVSQYITSAMAGRLMVPGIQADAAVVLIGSQGVGKTTAVKALAPIKKSYLEINLLTRDADQSRQLRGALIGELGELRGLRSREAEDIKAWMSRTEENWIPKYKEMSITFPRRITFWGTSNEHEFLTDHTGNRRWLPIEVKNPNAKLIEMDRDQIWAEAICLFNEHGIRWENAQKLANKVHEKHLVSEPLGEELEEYLQFNNGVNRHRIRDFWRHIRGDKPLDKREEMIISKQFSRLGYAKKRVQVNGIQSNWWEKSE